ncbi:MAG: hypothetical protein ACHQNA_09920, partial [Acidimicrobiales bacterium]
MVLASEKTVLATAPPPVVVEAAAVREAPSPEAVSPVEAPAAERARPVWHYVLPVAVVAALVGGYLLTRKPAAPPPAGLVLAWQETTLGEPTRAVKENDVARFEAAVRDPAQHPGVSYEWRLDGTPQATAPTWEYRPGYDEGGKTRHVTVVASDGHEHIDHEWTVQVIDVPRPPVIASAVPAPGVVEVPESGEQQFTVEADDPDLAAGDELTFLWTQNGKPVATGKESSWTLHEAKEGDQIQVTVKDKTGQAAEPRRWQVALRTVPSTTLPAVVQNHAPTLSAPKPGTDRPVSMEEGREIEFSARAEDVDRDKLAWTWFLDGREVGRASAWKFRAPAAQGAKTSHRVEVEVSDKDGLKSARLGWDVVVTPAPPRIADVQPQVRRLAIEPGQAQEFSATSSGDASALRFEWRLDGKPAAASVNRYRLPADLPAGSHSVEVALVDRQGTGSEPVRWTVEIATAKVTATTLPAPSGQITDSDVREWLAQYRSGYERKDVASLVAIGAVAPESAKRLEDILGGYQKLHLAITNETITADGTQMVLSFDRADTDETGKTQVVPRQTYRLEKGPRGTITARRATAGR